MTAPRLSSSFRKPIQEALDRKPKRGVLEEALSDFDDLHEGLGIDISDIVEGLRQAINESAA